MKKTMWLFPLLVLGLALAASAIHVGETEAQAVSTITAVPTYSVELFIYSPYEILWRGLDPRTRAIRQVTIRDKPNINGLAIGYLNPYEVWNVEQPYVSENGNVWGLLAMQVDKWIPLKYNGVYYTTWREN